MPEASPQELPRGGALAFFLMVFQKFHIKRRQSVTFCCEFEFQLSFLASLKGKYLLGKSKNPFLHPTSKELNRKTDLVRYSCVATSRPQNETANYCGEKLLPS